MEPDSQEEWVKKLETKLGELREQRIKVDEANEILRKKLQTLTKHLDDLDLKYGKDEVGKEETTKTTQESTANSNSDSIPVTPEPEKSRVSDGQSEEVATKDTNGSNADETSSKD